MKKRYNYFFLLFLHFIIPVYAMEDWFGKDNDDRKPLLEKDAQKHDTDARETDFLLLHALNKETPEITAHILSFLPGNDRGLNYLMRLDDFQPTTDPLEVSPFYSIVEKIRGARAEYFLKKYKECCENYRRDSFAKKNEKINKIIRLACAFMSITEYNNNEENKFFWLDIHELNRSIPPYTSDMLPLNSERVQHVLDKYVAQTYEYCTLLNQQDLDPYPYIHARKRILTLLKERIYQNPYLNGEFVLGNIEYPCGGCKTIGGFELGVAGCSATYTGLFYYVYYVPLLFDTFGIMAGSCLCLGAGSCCIHEIKRRYAERKCRYLKAEETFLLLWNAANFLENMKKEVAKIN